LWLHVGKNGWVYTQGDVEMTDTPTKATDATIILPLYSSRTLSNI
jgi:hypothetical protein